MRASGIRVARRNVLKAMAVAAAVAFGTGHTPYRQWAVYRRRHLLILTNRADPPSYPIGARLAAVLAKALPQSRARASRARDAERIASLISTEQLEVALLRRDEAVALMEGSDPFAGYGPVALRTLLGLDDYLLITRSDFPARHAYLLVETLSAHAAEIAPNGMALHAPERLRKEKVPLHAGARAYYEGRPPPP